VKSVSDASLKATYLADFGKPDVKEVVVNEPRRVRPLLSWDAGDGTWTLQSQPVARASFAKEAAARKPKAGRRCGIKQCAKLLTAHAEKQREVGLGGVGLWPGCETADGSSRPQTIGLVPALDDPLRGKQSRFVNFVAGRDRLLSAGELAAGVSLLEPSGKLALFSTTLPRRAYERIERLVSGMISAYYSGELDIPQKGTRVSAGQIDRVAFFSGPPGAANCGALDEALRIGEGSEGDGWLVADFDAAFGREWWVGVMKRDKPLLRTLATTFSANGRGMFIGLSTRVSGVKLKAAHSKGFTRGEASRDVADPNEVRSFRFGNTLPLPPSCRDETAALVAFAEAVWDTFVAAHPMEATAQRSSILATKDAHLVLGRTGWNSSSINLDWRTASHCDMNNAPSSWSALCVAETGSGSSRFYGGFYMLPQFRVALDARQGVVLFHRSSDRRCGVHANAELALPHEDPSVHRIALVFYYTTKRGGGKDKGGDVAAAAAEQELLEEEDEQEEE
jgi:hypothetical protein